MLPLKEQGSQISLQSSCVPSPATAAMSRQGTQPILSQGHCSICLAPEAGLLDKWAPPTKSSGGKAGTTPNSHHHFVNLSSQSFLRTVFGFLTYRVSFLSPVYALCMPVGRRKIQQAQGRCLAQGFSGRPRWCRAGRAPRLTALGAAPPCWESPSWWDTAAEKCRTIT